MSASNNSINLAGAVPNEAIDVANSKPDIRQAYSTTTASSYNGRSGDVGEAIENAASSNQILDLGSGEYELESEVFIGSGIGGIVGDGHQSCTIYYNRTDNLYMFSARGCSEFVMEGVTFDIRENKSADAGVLNSKVKDRIWAEDVVLRGQRQRTQGGSRIGGRFTFLVQVDSGGSAFIHRCQFPDGGTWNPNLESIGPFAIGPNADPSHKGLNVWKECYAEGFMDNGYYVNNSPGRNVLWNCTAVNNRVGNMRLGQNDVVVGGRSEVTSLPKGANGDPIVVNSGSNIHVVGLEMIGRGDAVGDGAEVVQIRSDANGVKFDKTVAHGNGVSHLARFDSGSVEVTDSWWLQENVSATAVQIDDSDVIADDAWRIRADGATEFSGSLTVNGQTYSGSTSASQIGLDDPRPLPTFHFDGVESGQGSDYGGGSGVQVAGWSTGSTGPRQIDGSDSPGSRWAITEDHGVTMEEVPQVTAEVIVEPQWFNE